MQNEFNETEVRKKFTINFMNDFDENFGMKSKLKYKKPHEETTSSGRKIRACNRKSIVNYDACIENKEAVYCYDDGLNIFGVLISTDDEATQNNTEEENDDFYDEEGRKKKKKKKASTLVNTPNIFIQLYDQLDGSLLKKFSFYANRKDSKYQLFIDNDKIVLIIRFIYFL